MDNVVTKIWLYAQLCDTINYQILNLKDMTMPEKPLPDIKEFIENVNKKDKPNGKRVRFAFTKRKRK